MKSKTILESDLLKLEDYLYEISTTYRPDMRVPARVYMNELMMQDVLQDLSLWQLVNMTTLPGISKYSLAMPDIHQGYGFPIGGVVGTIIDEGGVISPGGIGYDINCGVRLLVANSNVQEIKSFLPKLATQLFNAISSGVGKGGKLKLSMQEMEKVLQGGAQHMLQMGYGESFDIEFCQEQGKMSDADYHLVSERAKKRGLDQLGTLGSGNHFLEVQYVDKIYDEKVAQAFGLKKDVVVVMIHCGSRGLGHQTCTDYLRIFNAKNKQWKYDLPDRELIYVPFKSQEGQDYYKAMAAAANFAWANRHVITHWTREAWQKILGNSATLKLMYDVSHNLGNVETHSIGGIEKELVVHRKGATRSFGPNRKETSAAYRSVGQPVLIPGTMGTSSYVLAGTHKAMEQTFGSCCHGAGRKMSRTKAKKVEYKKPLRQQLEEAGIIIRCDSDVGLKEEAPIAYKNVDNVVSIIHNAGIASRVARLKPLAVIKGN